MAGYVYIVTNHKHGTLYIGVTSDLANRIYEHREEHFVPASPRHMAASGWSGTKRMTISSALSSGKSR